MPGNHDFWFLWDLKRGDGWSEDVKRAGKFFLSWCYENYPHVLWSLKVKWKCYSVVFNSLRPHGLWSTSLLCPWNFQARILEWVAIPFSGGSFWPRDQIQVSHVAGRFFTIWDRELRESLRVTLWAMGLTCGFFRGAPFSGDLLSRATLTKKGVSLLCLVTYRSFKPLRIQPFTFSYFMLETHYLSILSS